MHTAATLDFDNHNTGHISQLPTRELHPKKSSACKAGESPSLIAADIRRQQKLKETIAISGPVDQIATVVRPRQDVSLLRS